MIGHASRYANDVRIQCARVPGVRARKFFRHT
jgi:hypothetical protein